MNHVIFDNNLLDDNNTDEVFSVTQEDFRELSAFTGYAEQLWSLSLDYFNLVSPNIGRIGGGFRNNTRAKAADTFNVLRQNVDQIMRCSEDYLGLCRRIRELCGEIDIFCDWYKNASAEITDILNRLADAGFHTGKISRACEKAGLDAGVISRFFEDGSGKCQVLSEKAVAIEGNFKSFNEFFSNELPQKLDRVAPDFEQLSNILYNDKFVNLTAALQNRLSAIVRLYNMSKYAVNGLPVPAVRHMTEFVGHIGTHCNNIQTLLSSSYDALLSAEGCQYIISISAKLECSAVSLAKSKNAAESFSTVSSNYIR